MALIALTACGGQGNAENHNAQAVAVQFVGSVSNDTTAACVLLAPQTLKALEDDGGECAEGLAQRVQPSDGSVTSAQVYGKGAIVHLGADTIFLARFDDGWRVTAAGCTPQVGRPYDCSVKGK